VILVLVAAWPGRSVLAAEAPDACLIRLQGIINEAYAEAILRKIDKVRELGAKTVILEMDTFGGEVVSSMRFADTISRQDDLRIVTYINPYAFSAGTMVALACDEIYIDAAVGKMGDVAPINMATGEEMGEKQQAPIRKTLETYAEKRGYSVPLVHAMVSGQFEVFRIYLADDPAPHYITGTDLELRPKEYRDNIVKTEIVVRRGELLTLTAKDAVELGFAREAVGSRDELFDELGVDPGKVKRLYLSSSERLLAVVDTFSMVLIGLGLILFYMELNQPGFGLPGLLGLTCFAAFFLIKFSLHYAHMLELILFAIGVVLLIIEVFFIPGFGVAGIVGTVLIFASMVLMLQQFTVPGTTSEWRAFGNNILMVLATFVASGVVLVLLVTHMKSVPLLNRMIMRRTLAGAGATAVAGSHGEELSGLVGEVGLALTPLRPAGRAEFGDRQADVVTQGEFLERGTRVEVMEVHGPRVVVKAHEEA
jgi:membrane-bound serine protease (ClpP class)